MVLVDRGLCIPSVNRLKACLLAKRRQFEHQMWRWLWYEQFLLGLIKCSVSATPCNTICFFVITVIIVFVFYVNEYLTWFDCKFSGECVIKCILKMRLYVLDKLWKKNMAAYFIHDVCAVYSKQLAQLSEIRM